MNNTMLRWKSYVWALVLAATLVTLPGTARLAFAADHRGPDSELQSFWGRVTCGFALLLAGKNAGLYGEAVLICIYIESMDTR